MNNDNYRNGGGHDDVELNKLNEKSLFKDEKKTKEEPVAAGCCRSKHTKNCCIATGIFGGLFLILGVVVMLTGKSFLEKKIKNSLFLGEGSDM